ncbi:protein SPT2, partial [Tremellales sp. Uapishka_1]
MSEYRKLKARALVLQREKEEDLKRELAAKAVREKEAAKAGEERRKMLEAASKEARRLELMKANEALVRKDLLKQGLAPGAGSETRQQMAYDPFAEDERPLKASTTSKQIASASKPVRPKPSTGTLKPSVPRTTSKPTTSTAHTSNKTSPPPLSRKEKALKAFRDQATRASGDSLFSVHALVQSHEQEMAPSPKPIKTKFTSVNQPRPIAPPKKAGRIDIKKQLSGNLEGMRKLCPDRELRDQRTIDEIQSDIRRRREAKEGQPSPIPRAPQSIVRRPVPSPKRRRSPSSSSSSASTPPPRSKFPRRSPPVTDVSAAIRAMFTRPGQAQRVYRDDWSDDSDMEAGMEDVEREERLALRLAKEDDEREEKEERRRREAKEKLKRR